jgi:hypothetical protein
LYTQTDEWTDIRTERQTDGRMEGRTDGSMNRRQLDRGDRGTDGRADK